MKKKIIVTFSGGLGNQLYQYIFAKIVSIKLDAELYFDKKSGFYRDNYNRKFELNFLKLNNNEISFLDYLKLYFYRIFFKSKAKKIFNKFFFSVFMNDLNIRNFIEDINYPNFKYLFISGYWQSYKYFRNNYSIIFDNVVLPVPNENKYLKIYNKIKACKNSVAIGFRLYEETKDPSLQARGGQLKTINQINDCIKKIEKKYDNCEYFVFSTIFHDDLKKINIKNKEKIHFIISEQGFDCSVSKLWLLSQNRHFIFNNSTFYWWGAFLSQKNFLIKNIKQEIFASDNFKNKDSILPEWSQF